jgi:TonB family protein
LTENDVPQEWRDFFLGRTKTSNDYKENMTVPGLQSDGQAVFSVRPQDGIVPPVPLARSEPSYDDIARKARVQGTTVLTVVVNKQGTPEHIEVAKPIGVGLDDAAVETVSNWRFQPATLRGQPVAVIVSVEVAFRLY